MKKKLFCVLALTAILSMGLVGALAIVPHTHGEDFDHSQHQNCPVHQFVLAGLSAVVATAAVTAFFLAFTWLGTVYQFFAENHPSPSTSSRAPPISL